MNIREAILKAADHIEQNPHLFDYRMTRVPECGSPGCLVGWIAHFGGYEPRTRIFAIADGDDARHVQKWDLPSHDKLWTELREFAEFGSRSEAPPQRIARALRAYADERYPAEKPKHVGIPASVRAIFDTAQSCTAC